MGEFPFNPQVDPDYRVLMRPAHCAPEQRAAITQQISDWLDTDVIERVPDVDAGVNLVLVEGVQSGQKYRFCYNAPKLNAHSH